MRVTLKNGKRKIFYFDTVILENDTLKGCKSRILGLFDQVPFDQITKIEVQDGGKKYQKTVPTKNEIIQANSHQLFKSKGDVLEQLKFKIDTITVAVDKYKSVYSISCQFEKIQPRLLSLYYLNNDGLQLITTREVSTENAEVWWLNHFYVENNEIVSEENVGLLKNEKGKLKVIKRNDYKFDENLDSAFLRKLSLEIYNHIKTAANTH
jgi:hypothetical protein